MNQNHLYAYKNENKPITESEIYRILLLKQTVIIFNIVFLYQNISVNHLIDKRRFFGIQQSNTR